MKKHKEMFLGIVAVVGTLTSIFVLGEIAIRIIASRRLIYNIEMVRYAKLLKMRDPQGEVSHVHRPDSFANLMGVDIKLNSLGHRSPELSTQKSLDTKRIFILGSSVTMGWGVPENSLFTTLLTQDLNSKKPFGSGYTFEAANAGIGNYNTFAQFKLFERQYSKVHPDFVILHYFISDAEPRPPANNNPVLKYSFLCAFLYDRVRSAFAGRHDLFQYYRDIYMPESKPWLQTQNYIATMRDRLAKDGVPFLIMIVPDFHNLAIDSKYGAIYAEIESKFREMNISVINSFKTFQNEYGGHEQDLWISPEDPHPNALGHRVMAKTLYDEIVAKNPLRLRTENK